MYDFETLIASNIDLDIFTAEIWLNNNHLAMIYENGEVELYGKDEYKSVLESSEFLSV